MISIVLVFKLLLAHFIGDLVLQSYSDANNKCKNNLILLKHCVIYMATIYLFTLNILFSVVNVIIHLFVDYITSRLGRKYSDNNNHKLSLAVLAVDQYIHVSTLIITAYFIIK